MATDRIGIGGHGTCEVGGALMSSGTKRKVEELGGHVVSAVVGGVVDWSMSAAVARYEARTSVDDQLDRLRELSIMVHSAVEAAEGVHVRSWWLRRWLWKLRDAALDGDEVLRVFRQRRTVEETADAASRQATGTANMVMVWRALRSAKSLLFGRRGDNGGIEQLSRVVARLEREAVGIGDFLKMLELEMRRPPPVPTKRVKSALRGQVPIIALAEDDPDEVLQVQVSDFYGVELPGVVQQSLGDASPVSLPPQLDCPNKLKINYHSRDRSRFDHGISFISYEKYVAGVTKMGLLILMRRIRRVVDRLIIRKKPAAPPATPDTDRTRELVACIRLAVVRSSTGSAANLDFHRKRSWLSRWRNQLLNVAFRAEYDLLAVSVQADRDEDVADVSGFMRWTAQNVETAAAHLEDFATLAGFALASPSWYSKR